MDKRQFISDVRNWNARAVAKAIAEAPELANFEDRSRKTPLHHCAGINAKDAGLPVRNSIETTKTLIEAGADVNAVRTILDDGEEFHATPLWYAVAWGRNLRLSRFLLEQGAKPNGCMWAACWDQSVEMATLLRRFGAEVDPVFHDETPLLLIVKSKRMKLLPWLVANGANVNAQDKLGFTALHYAVKRNHNLKQMEQLLELGADPSLKARNGSSPMSLAEGAGKRKLVTLFWRALHTRSKADATGLSGGGSRSLPLRFG